MKNFRVCIFCFFLSFLVRAQNNIDVLNYKFSLELSDENDSVFAKAMISLIAPPQSNTISLDLQNTAPNGKGMTVTNTFYSSCNSNPLPFTHKDNSLILHLKDYTRCSDTISVIIEYKGIPSDGLIISKNKFGKRTFFADNWPDRAHHWIPCNDRPDDKSSFEFIVTAPAYYQVVSNGVMVEETSLPGKKKLTHWKEDIPLSTKVMVIGVADFAVNYPGTVNDCIPISSWVFPENKDAGFYDYALAKEILDFFIGYIGPYPFKKLANVQSKTIFGGMENAGAIFYHENSIGGHREEEMLFAHEIVHQWFGNMASEKDYSHLWLSEGFATYLTHIYTEKKYGQARFLQGLKNDREEVIGYLKNLKRPIVDSVTPLRQLINTNNYARAGWVLHMLRRQLGDSAFHKSIRVYYNTYKGKNAHTEDLQAVFEKISRKKLDSFFRQWLYTSDIPKLDIRWKYHVKTKSITIEVTQLQPSGPFRFPLDILLLGAPKPVTLSISKKSETFTIPSKTKPAQLTADPLISLLHEGAITEIK